MRKIIKLILIFIFMKSYSQEMNSINNIINNLNKNKFEFKIDELQCGTINEGFSFEKNIICINDSLKVINLYSNNSVKIYYLLDVQKIENLSSGYGMLTESQILIFSALKNKCLIVTIPDSANFTKNTVNEFKLTFSIHENYIFPNKILLNSKFEIEKILNISWMGENLPKDLLPATEYAVQDYNTGLLFSFKTDENYLNQDVNVVLDKINVKRTKLLFELPQWLKK